MKSHHSTSLCNTKLRRLGATAVAAEFVNRCMSRSRSRRVVLLLDCCYAGAFERSMTARAGTGMAIEEQFGGHGRAVITASSAMEYAFEGDKLADARELAPSVFTSALVEGLQTGEADRNQDGLVELDELYDYVYDRVRAATPNQTPGKWTFGVQGDLYIARRGRPVSTPAPLPAGLQEAIDSPFAGVRAGVVPELTRLLRSRHAGLALAARLTLERLADDDSRKVSAAATAALSPGAEPVPPAPPPSALEPATTTPSEAVPVASGPTRPGAQPKKASKGSRVKVIHVSDISGREADKQALARLVIHEHPKYTDLPVTLEVLPEEAESLQDASRFVTVELIAPGARRGERMKVSLDDFNLLASPGTMESAIQDALIAKHRSRPRAGGSGSPSAET